jgi:hypothetical protein
VVLEIQTRSSVLRTRCSSRAYCFLFSSKTFKHPPARSVLFCSVSSFPFVNGEQGTRWMLTLLARLSSPLLYLVAMGSN